MFYVWCRVEERRLCIDMFLMRPPMGQWMRGVVIAWLPLERAYKPTEPCFFLIKNDRHLGEIALWNWSF